MKTALKTKVKNDKIIDAKECGRRIRQLRKEKGMTQMHLAEKLHVSRSSVANWENGIRFPDYFAINQLTMIFGVPVDYIYGMSDHRYNINTMDYFEIDFTKLNSAGRAMMYEQYKLLLNSEKYTK